MAVRTPIYMDHHATTPVDPRVLERMLPFFSKTFGNASSRNHVFGWKAEEAVDVARGQVARAIGGTAREVTFTSGATEANNLAIFGVAAAYETQGKHIVTQTTEHKAVLDPLAVLEKRGWEITRVPVDRHGRVDPGDIKAALRSNTVLVSVMAVNNEVGTVQPLSAIGRICREAGVPLHTDATQALAWYPIDVDALGVDLLTLSAHKIYGPKGVGALYVRRKSPRVAVHPILFGGGHERGLRSGTLNVPGIVGLGEAAAIAQEAVDAYAPRVRALRDRLHQGFADQLEVLVHGHPKERHPGNLNVAFVGIEGEALLLAIRDVAVSSGAACASATLEPSHVLRAMQVPDDVAHSSLRFGLGRDNTDDEVAYVIDLVVEKAKDIARRDAKHRRATMRVR